MSGPRESEGAVTKQKPAKGLAVYTRVSEKGRRSDEEMLSHDLQRDRVEKYLSGKGIPASGKKFEDTDKSGGKMSRPAFDRAVGGVLSGKYGGIAVARLSRFGRTTSGVLDLIAELEGAGGAVICIDPAVDTSTASGRAMLTVFLAFVTMEREQAVEQAGLVAGKKLAALREGDAPNSGLGGLAPLGYAFEITGQDSNGKDIRGGYVPDPAAAVAVREAFEMFDRGELVTPGRVADFLNARGLRTKRTRKAPQGNPWNAQNIIGLLRREAYIGMRTYGEERVVDAHEAIVPADVFRRVQRRLQPKDGPRTRVRGEGHALGQGLIRCGHCNGALSKGLANGNYATLRCNARGSGHASIAYASADDWIVAVAFAHAGMSLQHDGGNAEEVETAQMRVDSARQALLEVEELRGTIAAASFALAHSDALSGVEDAEDALGALVVEPGAVSLVFPAGNRAAFEALAMAEKRAALRSIVSRVVIRPGRGTPAERIVVEFQDGGRHPAEWTPESVPWTALDGTLVEKAVA